MPSWDSIPAFIADVDRTLRDLQQKEAKRITRQMAERAESIAVRTASGDLGGDPQFSGWIGGDRSLDNLQIKPLRSSVGHILAPTRKSGGPWKVAEIGRNRSVSQFGGATGRGGGALFQGPGVNRQTGATSYTKTGKVRVRRGPRRRWNGYTSGKSTASQAVAAMERELPKIADVEVRRVISKRFDTS